ncbi:MAG: futalosine hydrolase [Thermodesulfobacteriota bacterium]
MSAWLLIIAMEAEARLLISRLTPAEAIGGRPAFAGRLGGQDMLLLLSGLGQVNAAQAVTAALETRPEIAAVVNLGCAGAYPDSGLRQGQAILASEVVLADLGVQTQDYLHGLEKVGIPLAQGVYNRLPCDAGLNQRLLAARPELAQGVFATVGRVSGDQATARAVAARWGAAVEDMESAAVGLVARHYGRPFAALRGISNLAGQRELDVAAGAEAAQRALLALEEA